VGSFALTTWTTTWKRTCTSSFCLPFLGSETPLNHSEPKTLSRTVARLLSLCAASRMWVRHRSVLIVTGGWFGISVWLTFVPGAPFAFATRFQVLISESGKVYHLVRNALGVDKWREHVPSLVQMADLPSLWPERHSDPKLRQHLKALEKLGKVWT